MITTITGLLPLGKNWAAILLGTLIVALVVGTMYWFFRSAKSNTL